MVEINYIAVFVAALAHYVLGMLWYGPLFGKPWLRLMKVDPKKMNKSNMGWRYLGGFVTALVMSFVLAYFVDYTGAVSALGGIMAGFWLWLGFIATVAFGSVLWENKPFSLYVINNGYYLVGLLIMGTILAVWV